MIYHPNSIPVEVITSLDTKETIAAVFPFFADIDTQHFAEVNMLSGGAARPLDEFGAYNQALEIADSIAAVLPNHERHTRMSTLYTPSSKDAFFDSMLEAEEDDDTGYITNISSIPGADIEDESGSKDIKVYGSYAFTSRGIIEAAINMLITQDLTLPTMEDIQTRFKNHETLYTIQ